MNMNKSIRFTAWQMKKLEREAKQKGLKFSALIKKIVEEHLKGKE